MRNIQKLRKALTISYSRLSLFFNCPFIYNEKYINGNKHTQTIGPALIKGIKEHKLYESLLNEEQTVEELENKVLSKVRLKEFVKLTKKLGLTFDDIEAESDFTLKFDNLDCKLRVILDGLAIVKENNTAYLFEFKTGRSYPTHIDQCEFYSYFLLQKYPELTQIKYYIYGLEAPFSTINSIDRDKHNFNRLEKKIKRLVSFYDKYEKIKNNIPKNPNICCNSCLLPCKYSKLKGS